MNCLNCGTVLGDYDTYCPVCGTPISQQDLQSVRSVYYDQINYGQASQDTNMADNSADLVNSKKATSSMVWGIVTLSVNTIMMCSMVLNGPFLFGGIWCFGPIKVLLIRKLDGIHPSIAERLLGE
ncbi:MAG: zinc ribbon domain-containing protein [Lachnospiraceae bacterium]|nr:zinc ribbon domain-containing protein [Lachnospiraceae bacterium]